MEVRRAAAWRAAVYGGAALLCAALGCRRSTKTEPTSEPEPDQARTSAPTPATRACLDDDGSRTVRVEWRDVTSTGNCFFFSGPQRLGRDTKLGTEAQWTRRGNAVTLAFGPAQFTGDGKTERLRLRRLAKHEHGGRWTTIESIALRPQEASSLLPMLQQSLIAKDAGPCPKMVGDYAYSECEVKVADNCPGRCAIRATLVLQVR